MRGKGLQNLGNWNNKGSKNTAKCLPENYGSFSFLKSFSLFQKLKFFCDAMYKQLLRATYDD